jgi:dihydroxy-acid dehydratase
MMVQSQRVDGIIALSTCDKIVPAQLMALARINLPAIMVTGGAMLSGKFKGKKIQAQHINEMYPDWKKGNLTDLEYKAVEDDACPTCGACCTMGTANTMCCMTEALGMSLPGNGSALSVNSALYRIARRAGRKIMELIVQDIRPRQIITPKSVENAMMVHSAIGGSTNAVIHIPAILNEIEVEIPLNRWNEISAKVPHLVNTTAGSDYTIEDFGTAGGVQAVMLELKEKLHLDVMTCTGSILADNSTFGVQNEDDGSVSSQVDALHRGFDGGVEDRLACFLTKGAHLAQAIQRQAQDAQQGFQIGQIAHLLAAGVEQVPKGALIG